MERYTKRLESGIATWNYGAGCNSRNGAYAKIAKSTHRQAACETLANYEDTGLTAGEVEVIKAENAALKKKLDMAIKDLQGDCFACANKDECKKKYPCYCFEGSAFEWRGEEDTENV